MEFGTELTKKLLSRGLALAALGQHIVLYPQSILSLMVIKKSFAPITRQTSFGWRQPSLIGLPITVGRNGCSEPGKRTKENYFLHTFSTSCTGPGIMSDLLQDISVFRGSSGV